MKREDEHQPVDEALTLSIDATARLLGIGRGLAYELARTGEIPVIRLGRRMLVPKARLEALLAGDGRDDQLEWDQATEGRSWSHDRPADEPRRAPE